MTKKWTYVEPNEDGVSPVYTTLSEKEIIGRYWDWWYNEIVKRKGKEIADSCTEQDCIDDFVTVHWAWEEEDNAKNL